jgi:UDP-N-acetylmuramoyl-L-alanyl-D-glutamate--2,6-diaminopimelate ligase
MKLEALLARFLSVPAHVRGAAVEVHSISDDSRTVTPGTLFVARTGTTSDGRAFVADAVTRGAVAVLHVGEDPCADLPAAASVVRVRMPDGTDLVRFSGLLAERLEGNPSEWLRMVGITGTNGKTTMAFLIKQFVVEAGSPCGVIGTVVIDDGAVAEPANLTTPGAIETARALGRMVRNGCSACAMEVSSHALDQGRADALRFRTAVFSNLTGDHLDYHGTMQAYAAAKARLFRMLSADGTAVVNADDPWHATMVADCAGRVLRCSVGTDAQPPQAVECTATVHASRLGWQDTTFTGPWGSVRVKLPIVGRHNAMNALEAAAAAWSIGVPAEAISRALAACKAPPGRLEPVTTPDDPFAVLVDYAHTDDALLNVLTALRPLVGPGGRLVTVFGCGGDRDRTKRPRMMKVACAHSDRVIVTSDNPRTEDPEAIIDEVFTGRPQGQGSAPAATPEVVRQVDRARAIAQAVTEARAGDIVLIAGKGHEDYQIIGTVKRPFDDRHEALAALGRAMSSRSATLLA